MASAGILLGKLMLIQSQHGNEISNKSNGTWTLGAVIAGLFNLFNVMGTPSRQLTNEPYIFQQVMRVIFCVLMWVVQLAANGNIYSEYKAAVCLQLKYKTHMPQRLNIGQWRVFH